MLLLRNVQIDEVCGSERISRMYLALENVTMHAQ